MGSGITIITVLPNDTITVHTSHRVRLCLFVNPVQESSGTTMANHYHLLVETPKANLSLGMRQLNGIYTQAFNRRHKRIGHLFQGRFKAILVEKESYLLELCRYIVLNPIRVRGNVQMEKRGHSTFLFLFSAVLVVLGLRSNQAQPPCEQPSQLNRRRSSIDTMPYLIQLRGASPVARVRPG